MRLPKLTNKEDFEGYKTRFIGNPRVRYIKHDCALIFGLKSHLGMLISPPLKVLRNSLMKDEVRLEGTPYPNKIKIYLPMDRSAESNVTYSFWYLGQLETRGNKQILTRVEKVRH